PTAVQPDRPLQEVGLDSLMAVELKNRLVAATGLRLPTTFLFDHPTPVALARQLVTRLWGADDAPRPLPALPASTAIATDADPIAIVAMSCRLPGDVRSPDDLWSLLRDGKDVIGRRPTNRGWRVTVDARQGGYLEDADRFDPVFFGISPREAL